jgi:exodeoxyribonuclease V alpha subunit
MPSIRGRCRTLKAPEGLIDFYFIEAQEPEAIQDLIVRLVKERIPARFGYDPKADIQVLSPMNRTLLGARNLNQVLQTALNPGDGGPEVERFGWTFRIGDRVIQTENDYDRDVFNGDLGMIEKINRIEQGMVVNFEGRQVEYDFGDLDELALACVLSIHKSQGSEFPCVVIPVHTQHYMMLQRNLLYTAVTTRAAAKPSCRSAASGIISAPTAVPRARIATPVSSLSFPPARRSRPRSSAPRRQSP